ncbi:DUF2752 domain-containing protein [Polaribacter glomeratus]|uniref:DUF2752 domain-containing protein n=1 Tax=Polaribacter glomeratus TaxID=102 RepID=A0A2S7WVY5_9FLAO|nr:DUF2752 domain-containing protein [Polaribacter glomeratus]PQJ81763.1 hypothetical protein BTO16_03895 [Polaribacter glomeratus]TXD66502.1 DUF2752 domain-containing protein [Polaribacter glomeratus]
MLPCLNKKLFGLDCLGCGFQRGLIHVLKGDFTAAFNVYPAIFTLLFLAIFLLLNIKFKFKNSKKISIIFVIINVLIIVISYFIKMKPLFIN